jgi:putative tryptophan/tyrosine transport system substrate-binding protein
MKSAWLLVGFSCLVFVSTVPTETRAGDFTVTLLGTASPQARPNRFGPSTLVEVGGQTLLFDAGRGVPIRMGQLKVPIGKIDILFITHYHSDHVSGIPDVWLSGWLGSVMGRRKSPFHVIGPTGAKNLMTNLEKAYALDISIREADEKLPPQGIAVNVEEFDKDGVVYEKGGVKVIAFEVDHGPAIKPAYGYRIEYKGHMAVISGDTRYNENVIKYGTGVDLLIHEVAIARPELMSNLFAQFITHAQRAIPVIGFLGPAAARGYAPQLDGFRQGLDETGFIEGKTVEIEYRWADSHLDRLPALAGELVSLPVAVLVTGGATAAALAAKESTATIPVVFAVGADPVKSGLVASMNRPGGNVTGVSFLANILVAKQLQLLQELVPTATVIGALINPGNPVAASDTSEMEKAAQSLGQQIHIVHAGTEQEFDAVFDVLAVHKVDALLIVPDALFTNGRERLASLAARHRLPTIYTTSLYADAGGLASYGTDQKDAFRQIGIYTGRILKGEKPSDLPVVQSVKFELAINLKTAKTLGLAISPTLLARADKVIE